MGLNGFWANLISSLFWGRLSWEYLGRILRIFSALASKLDWKWFNDFNGYDKLLRSSLALQEFLGTRI